MSRFILLGICVYFLLNAAYPLSCLLLVLIWVSDLLDGYFARSRNEISELGKIIDPLADKLTVIFVVLILLYQGVIPTYYFLITVLRDVIILIGGLYLKYRKNITLQSNWPGKVTVFSIGLTIFISIVEKGAEIGQFGDFMLYHNEITELLFKLMVFISIGLSILSLIIYFKRFKETINI